MYYVEVEMCRQEVINILIAGYKNKKELKYLDELSYESLNQINKTLKSISQKVFKPMQRIFSENEKKQKEELLDRLNNKYSQRRLEIDYIIITFLKNIESNVDGGCYCELLISITDNIIMQKEIAKVPRYKNSRLQQVAVN